ncbi:hypothetical protein CAOG_01852 [Capsaspora owczarzaki ATCC 30864]|uniref:Rieske domain-containing protein n=1 Tax=Capsaspora owczarzaki (strain ATCC 30864) TaxID=595528 RepID=A0A0D2WK42_CAPO3|nr:hypothetical protein CAOG_01852 [Capsaspora owczarzaki ATCC 30864]KJE90550.1 hypothetical protein CAOG_001852 [Capsaspora owczarzaki ATCC 30864]|eukprot:XP_004364720.1 hypothetical protein CAOG_01852 [Capsaspora owczarzaki ATCC 30864]
MAEPSVPSTVEQSLAGLSMNDKTTTRVDEEPARTQNAEIASAGTANEQPTFVDVGIAARDLLPGRSKHVQVQDRQVAIFRTHAGALHALDHLCYHMGSPLASGDIEDIGGHACVICPWHKYVIALDTGEGFYKKIDPYAAKGSPPELCSKGVRQRVHHVRVGKGDKLEVALSISKEPLASDHYHQAFAQGMERMKQAGLSVSSGVVVAGGLPGGSRAGS